MHNNHLYQFKTLYLLPQNTLGDPVIMLIGNKNDLDPQVKSDYPSTESTNLTTGLSRVPYEQCQKVT